MRKLLLSISLAASMFVFGSAYAQSYQMYKCTDTNSCSGQCSPVGSTVIFLTNKAKSVVMAQFYEAGQFKRSDTFENCKAIFNEKNWDCSSQSEHLNGVILFSIKMTNGVYQAKTTSFLSTPNGLVTQLIGDVCAK